VWNKLGEGLFFEPLPWLPLLNDRFLEQVFYDFESQLSSEVDDEEAR
tara:strand:- start:125 stop:265 length:141 start_codon:yes stop_codon:yes gene_type:complete